MKRKRSERLLTFVYAEEAWHHSKKSILAFTGVLVGIWGVINSLLNKDIGWQVLMVLVVVGLLHAICVFLYWYVHIKNGRMSISLFRKREVTLLRMISKKT